MSTSPPRSVVDLTEEAEESPPRFKKPRTKVTNASNSIDLTNDSPTPKKAARPRTKTTYVGPPKKIPDKKVKKAPVEKKAKRQPVVAKKPAAAANNSAAAAAKKPAGKKAHRSGTPPA